MKHKPMSEHIHLFDQRAEKYANYLENLKERRFITEFGVLDQCIRGVAPGEVMTIIAYSGTFKTALLHNLLMRGAKRTNMYHLFFSQEMPVTKLFEREMQLVGRTNGQSIEENYRDQKEAYDSVAKGMRSDKLIVIDQSKLSLRRMEDYFHLVEVKYGEVVAMGIDYLGLMESDGRNLFEKTAELTFGVKQLAKELNRPIILLCQTNRAYAASRGIAIEMDAGKGGGDVEAGADFLLGLYMQDGELICRLLKNRNGPGNVYFRVIMDYPSLTFKDMIRWEPPKKKERKDNDV